MLRNILRMSSSISRKNNVNLFPVDVYPIVGIVSFACLMGVGTSIHTLQKPCGSSNAILKVTQKSQF